MAGVKVILRIRQNMFEMRTQFDTILEDLAKMLNDTIKKMIIYNVIPALTSSP